MITASEMTRFIDKAKDNEIDESFRDFDEKSDMCITACDNLTITIGKLKDFITQLKGATPGEEQLRELNNTFEIAISELGVVTSIRSFLGI